MGLHVSRTPRENEASWLSRTPSLSAANLSFGHFPLVTRAASSVWETSPVHFLLLLLALCVLISASSSALSMSVCENPFCTISERKLPHIRNQYGDHRWRLHSDSWMQGPRSQSWNVMYTVPNCVNKSKGFHAERLSRLQYSNRDASAVYGSAFVVPVSFKLQKFFRGVKCSNDSMLSHTECCPGRIQGSCGALALSAYQRTTANRADSFTNYSSSGWFLDTIERKVLAQVSDTSALNMLLSQYQIARNKASSQAVSERVDVTSSCRDLSLESSVFCPRPSLEVEPLFGEDRPNKLQRFLNVSSTQNGSVEPLSFYVGVDLTAPSLHAGHLLPLLLLRRLWQQEHVRPILLLGTATTRLAFHARRSLAAHSGRGTTRFLQGPKRGRVSTQMDFNCSTETFGVLSTNFWKQYDSEIHENGRVILAQLRRIFAVSDSKTPNNEGLPSSRNSVSAQTINDTEKHNSMFFLSERSDPETAELPVPLVVRNSCWLDGLSCGAFLCSAAQVLPISDMLLRMRSRESALASGREFRRDSRVGVGVPGVSTVGDLGYAVLQALDFFVLAQSLNCRGQIGGRDQWGNIATGLHVAKRLYLQHLYKSPGSVAPSENQRLGHIAHSEDDKVREDCVLKGTPVTGPAEVSETQGDPFPLVGLTTQLLETTEGKMSKTAGGGTLWLRPDWTSPLDFWQYWRSVNDHVALRYLLWFSSRSASQIMAFAGSEEVPRINQMKEALADELTRLVHGEEELSRVRSLVGHFNYLKSTNTSACTPDEISNLLSLPVTHRIHQKEFTSSGGGPLLCKVLRDMNFAESGLEAKRLIRGGAVRINGIKETNADRRLLIKDFLVSAHQQNHENLPTGACLSAYTEQEEKSTAAVDRPSSTHGKAAISVGRKRLGVLALDATS